MGRPCEDRIILKSFEKLREKAGLPKVVFHSLRHSSTTYKLKLNHGDLKATQGDTGHAQIDMITGVYARRSMFLCCVYYKLQTFLYLPANGIVQAMRPIIGYNYGAGEHARVQKIYRVALALSACIMAVGTALCWLVPAELIGLFSQNAETIAAGSAALRTISLGFVISSVSVIACGALEGLGMGVPSLVISLLRYTLFIIPAAFLLSRLCGARGVWHAFWITEVATAISYALYRKKVSAHL